ncbi:ABC transporter substrate-binding protein, partial [Cupriavidus sp. IK-TO18]|nr:ABC transporter substrate-binding protein [Cupriavidus sp. IK-TO18]
MSDSRNQLENFIGPSESLRMMEALKGGATRRDVLKMLLAGGMQATLAGGLAGAAVGAHAQTPRRGGRIRVAAATAAASDTLDPAKQSNQNDYVRCNMVYNGLTSLDR